MSKDFPVGKAQQVVLNALGLTADGFIEANKIFADHGLIVGSRREGRASVPVVNLKETSGGGFNDDGEGEAWEIEYKPVDFSKIAQWMVTK